MPFLDADALKSEPDGMAFLRSVIVSGPVGDEAPEAALGLARRLSSSASRAQRLGTSQTRERRARAKMRA